MDDYALAWCVVLRGLGYTHKEIADKLGLKMHQVQYAFYNLNEESRLKGDSPVYLRVMSAGFGPKLLKVVEKLGA